MKLKEQKINNKEFQMINKTFNKITSTNTRLLMRNEVSNWQ